MGTLSTGGDVVAKERRGRAGKVRKGGPIPDTPPTLEGQVYDAAGDLPGPQLSDPDQVAQSGVHTHRIPPHRR